MKREEFVENIAIGDQLISVGLDDYGQCYFIEYVEDGEIKEESCGCYNFNYKDYIEGKFGEPLQHCPYYPQNDLLTEYTKINDCEQKGTYGYCYKCKYNDLEKYAFKTLIDLGVIDRRGNLIGPWNDILTKIDNNDNSDGKDIIK